MEHTKVDNELGDLETGDPLLPPNTDATCRLEVVPVHDDMDHKVKSNRDPRLIRSARFRRLSHASKTYDGGATNELGVAEESSGTVVVAVKESWVTISCWFECDWDGLLLKGFFLTTRKTVSRSSRYLVR